MRDFQSFVGKDPYGMRRVTEFEKYVKARPEKYDIHTIGAKVNYGSSTPEIPKLTGIQVGDIITTRDVNGGRHIVICTAVSGGIPTRCIHASGTRSAVVETAFYNTPGTPRPYDAILPMR
jgi:hypothetical protein